MVHAKTRAEPPADDPEPVTDGSEPAPGRAQLPAASDDVAPMQESPGEAMAADGPSPASTEQDCECTDDAFTDADASEKAQSRASAPVEKASAGSEESLVFEYDNRGDRLLFTQKMGSIVYRRQSATGRGWLHLEPGPLKDRLEQEWEAEMAKRGAHKTL